MDEQGKQEIQIPSSNREKLAKMTTTLIDDFVEYSQRMISIDVDLINGKLDHAGRLKAIEVLKEEFKDKINESDNHTFETLEEMVNFLREGGFLHSEVQQAEQHETEHLEKAKSLGYTPTVGVWILKTLNGSIAFSPYIAITGLINPITYPEVVKAATDQSKFDENFVEQD